MRRAVIAVLPFENRSHAAADAYLADGMHEALATRLAQVARLALVSSAAVRRAAAEAATPALVGRTLGAAFLVSGSVSNDGGRLRVAAELVRAAGGMQVWSAQYDRAPADQLAIEADIAQHVAGRVLGPLSPDERASLALSPTTNPAAYDLYLRGSSNLFAADPTTVQRTISAFEGAAALDPRFAAAYGRLAYVYGRAVEWNVPLPAMEADSMIARGVAAADRALALDSASAEAWAGRGIMLFHHDPADYGGALQALRRAVVLDSLNAPILIYYGITLRRLGDYESADAAFRRAIAADPRAGYAYWAGLGVDALARRDYRGAEAFADTGIALDSSLWQAFQFRGQVASLLRDTVQLRQDAAAIARRIPPALRRYARGLRAELHFALGDTVRARAALDSALADLSATGPLSPRDQFLIGLLARTGQGERALDLIERVRPRGAWLWSYLILPFFDGLRADPRFVRVIDEARPPGAPRMP